MGFMYSAPTYVAAGTLVAALGLAAPVAASGPTRVASASAPSALYVSVHGSDRSSGASQHPLRTIQAAINPRRRGARSSYDRVATTRALPSPARTD